MDIQQDANNYMQKIKKITSRDISDLFQITLGISDHTQLKRHDNNEASLDATGKDNPWISYMQQINKIAQPFP